MVLRKLLLRVVLKKYLNLCYDRYHIFTPNFDFFSLLTVRTGTYNSEAEFGSVIVFPEPEPTKNSSAPQPRVLGPAMLSLYSTVNTKTTKRGHSSAPP